MTFEEIQKTIEGMLQVQRDIQNQQLKNNEVIAKISEQQEKNEKAIARLAEQQEKSQQKIDILTENINNLNIVSQRHENRLTQLYGYSMSTETDMLNIRQNLNDIKRRLVAIEEKLNAR